MLTDLISLFRAYRILRKNIENSDPWDYMSDNDKEVICSVDNAFENFANKIKEIFQ